MSKQQLIIIASDSPKVTRKIDKAKRDKAQSEAKSKRLDIIVVNGQRRVVVRND